MASMSMMSCEEEIILDTGDFESKLVVNSLFNHEIPWSIHVSNTRNILDNSTRIDDITNAKVEIYNQNNEFLYELYHIENGVYGREDFSPSPSRGYSVKVSAPGFHAVTAKSFVPEKSKLMIYNFSIIPNETYDDVEVDFEIEDRSKLESYYIWEIVSIDETTEGGNGVDPLSKSWIDDLTNKSNALVEESREILEGDSFGDGTYRGTYNSIDGNRSIKLVNNVPSVNAQHVTSLLAKAEPNVNLPEEINHHSLLNGNDEESEGEKVVLKYELRVMSISKELYDYYSSVEEYIKFKNDSDGVPYEIYTNVSNGLGIFAGFSESVIQF